MANASAKAIVTGWLRGKATPPAAHADTVPPTESDKGSLSNVMELIASFPTDSNYLTDMNMNFFSVVIGLALCLFLYLLIELIRLVRLYHYQRHLHDHRTPLSAGFDREKWGRFMLGALQREAALGRDHVRLFVESCFYDMPAEKLTRGDIDKWLRMYTLTQSIALGAAW